MGIIYAHYKVLLLKSGEWYNPTRKGFKMKYKKQLIIGLAAVLLLVVSGLVLWTFNNPDRQHADALQKLKNTDSVELAISANFKAKNADILSFKVDGKTELSLSSGLSRSKDKLQALGSVKELDYYLSYGENSQTISYFLENKSYIKKNDRMVDLNNYEQALESLKEATIVKDDELGYCLSLGKADTEKLISGLMGMYIDSKIAPAGDKVLMPIKINDDREITNIDLNLTQGVNTGGDLDSQLHIKLGLSNYNKKFDLKTPRL